MTRAYWILYAAGLFYTAGYFVFAIVYNLALLGAGMGETAAGMTAGALTAGHMLGALPSAWLSARLGLGRTVVWGLAATGLIFAGRVFAVDATPRLLLALAGGCTSAVWQVCFPCIVARAAPQRQTWGFSLYIGSAIATGAAVGSGLGDRPPQEAMLWGAGAMLLGAGIAGALPPFPGSVSGRPNRLLPRSRRTWQICLAAGAWNLAVSLLQPFGSLYGARVLQLSQAGIGRLFAAGQLGQVLALLAAPWLMDRFGWSRGMAGFQLAAAMALLGLAAAGAHPTLATVAYAAFFALQYMSEPGVYAAVMRAGDDEQQRGAGLLVLLMNAAQAISAPLAGAAFERFGYPPVLITGAALAAATAVVFARFSPSLLGKPES